MKKADTSAGRTRNKPTKISVQERALVGWLADDPENRFAMVSGRSCAIYEKLEQNASGKRPVRKFADYLPDDNLAALREWFGGEIKFRGDSTSAAGYVVNYAQLGRVFKMDERKLFAEAVKDIYIAGQWNLDSSYIGITPEGLEWWATEGREAHLADLKKLAEAAEVARAAERRAVFGWVTSFMQRVPDEGADLARQGYELPLPRLKGMRPMLTAIIVRETATRYYVRDARHIRGGDSITYSAAVHQHGKEFYIEKDRLLLDNASDADLAALTSFDDRQQQDHYERCTRAADELLPILRRHVALAKQNGAEHDDMMRELLARLSGK